MCENKSNGKMREKTLFLLLCIAACVTSSNSLFCTKMQDLQQSCRIYSEFVVKELPDDPTQHLAKLEDEAATLAKCPSSSMFCFTVLFQYYLRMSPFSESIINNVNVENTVSLNTPSMQNIQLCDSNKQTLCGSECFQNFDCPNTLLNFSSFPYDAHLYTCLNNSFVSFLDEAECNVCFFPAHARCVLYVCLCV